MRGHLAAGLAVLAAVSALAACTATPDPASPSTASTSPVVEESPVVITNPVYPFDFPDPQIIADGDGYLAIATNGNGMNVQTIRSDDLATWRQGVDALPSVAPWSSSGKVWAPEVVAWPGAGYRMYYTTKAPDPAWQCISVAVGESLGESFADESAEPLICEIDEGGSIDASPFVDADGTAYLYWKNDGNAIGVDTWIKAAPLSDDGLSLAGPVTTLFRQDLPWEGHLVEGPAVVQVDGVYHMFYSANDYGSADYAVGHAVSDNPLGPFTKDPDPVLSTNELAAGPGHCQLFQVGDQWWMVYHAWPPDSVGDPAAGRQMWLSKVSFEGESVTVRPPELNP
ncbi:glycoside hydrolase family 43 protein [Tessaracoccus caeni]|uniref:glycoside hydrolase family 43 protein n=1 Tax=Tessaracoccus caeni TaxID=3031239 RepID=UPI0023DA5760|nr:glycoside hydrolase family 43 protein [Tessaracoccus caeni]MDF1487649.1 glycoside hydrolase family 43 protein [Tessaracoccus caeni]